MPIPRPFRVNATVISKIMAALSELELEYQTHKALILTESDLHCHLFNRIYNLFPDYETTIDSEISGSALHSEVPFFDEDGQLTLVPDLTVISPANVSIFHSVEFKITKRGPKYHPYSRKSFEIGGDAIIIELKFCRSPVGITPADVARYQVDIDKINRIQSIVANRSAGYDKLYGIFALFNKTNLNKSLFDDFIVQNTPAPDSFLEDEVKLYRKEFFYGTGMVDFSSSSRHFTEGFIPRMNSIN